MHEMPSIKKRVYGLMRTFSPSQGANGDTDSFRMLNGDSTKSNEPSFGGNSFIAQYLNGRLKKSQQPEIYYGKTGVDLPVIHLETFKQSVCASYTGPDGGLTEVPSVRKGAIANIANLDDELSLSVDGDSSYTAISNANCSSCNAVVSKLEDSSYEADLKGHETSQHRTFYDYDWTKSHNRAYGLSTSLYEKHPFSGNHAGDPIADVFGVVARENSCLMALADGVNWGDRARLAARCAVRAAIDHLNETVFVEGLQITTLEVFHELLAAFHLGQQLILQEGGLLTTLCVAVVAKVSDSDVWTVCACNVGDSLCFVYNKRDGVREVTLGSHDIGQNRDMRDAGGALGPVDGVNPELQNLTCSMTFVDPDDLVFITSDGVSDNFDPVVGKFCIINRSEIAPVDKKENNGQGRSPTDKTLKAKTSMTEEDDGGFEEAIVKVNLPFVDAFQRHELMLLRMEDLLINGVSFSSDPSSARNLCENLIHFATQISMAKRRTLEDPDLYRVGEKDLSRSDQRARRKTVRAKIADMAGKLDHATVVAYRVGLWPHSLHNANNDSESTPTKEECTNGEVTDGSLTADKSSGSDLFPASNEPLCCEVNIDETFVNPTAGYRIQECVSASNNLCQMATISERIYLIDGLSSSLDESDKSSHVTLDQKLDIGMVQQSTSTTHSICTQSTTAQICSNAFQNCDHLPIFDCSGDSDLPSHFLAVNCSNQCSHSNNQSTEPKRNSDDDSIKEKNIDAFPVAEGGTQIDISKEERKEPLIDCLPPTFRKQDSEDTEQRKNKRRKHERGSVGRHTLSGDVHWLKRFVPTLKKPPSGERLDDTPSSSSASRQSSFNLKQRMRDIRSVFSFRSSQRNLSLHKHSKQSVVRGEPRALPPTPTSVSESHIVHNRMNNPL